MLKNIQPSLILRIICFNLIINLLNASENILSWHESRTIVNNESTSRSIFVSRSFEPWPNLHVESFYIDRSLIIKEFWSISKLNHASLAHSLLYDDVQDLTHSLAILTTACIMNVWSVHNILANMIDLQPCFLTHPFNINEVCLTQLLSRPNVESWLEELSYE